MISVSSEHFPIRSAIDRYPITGTHRLWWSAVWPWWRHAGAGQVRGSVIGHGREEVIDHCDHVDSPGWKQTRKHSCSLTWPTTVTPDWLGRSSCFLLIQAGKSFLHVSGLILVPVCVFVYVCVRAASRYRDPTDPVSGSGHVDVDRWSGMALLGGI